MAAVIDRELLPIRALDPADDLEVSAYVAGPAALLVAKLHELGERREQPSRLLDKDAYDIYRLLVAVGADELEQRLQQLLDEEPCAQVTSEVLDHVAEMFADSPNVVASMMAGPRVIALRRSHASIGAQRLLSGQGGSWLGGVGAGRVALGRGGWRGRVGLGWWWSGE